MHLLYFALIWILAIYFINCLIARKIIAIDWPVALYYVTSTAMLGMIGEIVIDAIYLAMTGELFWIYHVLPIHKAYTSQYSFFLWGLGGFNFYLLHKTLKSFGITSIHKLAGIFTFESIIIDGVVNLAFLIIFGSYIYYYLPGDLFHLTSLRALPFYLLAGYIAFTMYKAFERKRTQFTIFSIAAVILLAIVLPGLS